MCHYFSIVLWYCSVFTLHCFSGLQCDPVGTHVLMLTVCVLFTGQTEQVVLTSCTIMKLTAQSNGKLRSGCEGLVLNTWKY